MEVLTGWTLLLLAAMWTLENQSSLFIRIPTDLLTAQANMDFETEFNWADVRPFLMSTSNPALEILATGLIAAKVLQVSLDCPPV
ncbi:MAG: uncharacterized protein KVP18_002104 [Porospora cf. gigantea A]|uniref:uncharacterized protein n=1 Tax=Porospora cf. gigantea A TaxID=2853593 RepID=UPI00355A0C9E|nr:MAG: hypothetical protein KVP18_002104 [Porospora cf. gigantea A]